MRYRKEIDGLRALAVIPVILFHTGFESFSGGFVGVDVFFVISGYLITSIILTEKQAGTFSLLNFYQRRARRILPALFFVMLCCFPFAWAWMLPDQLRDFARSLFAVSIFCSNILFQGESGYFDPGAEENPLLHTWSLAVEEQYYIIFPIFIILFWSLGRRRLISLIIIAAAVSLGLSEIGSKSLQEGLFYSSMNRAWEILAGALCAFYLLKRSDPKGNQWLSSLGIGLIIYAVLEFDGSTPFPSLYTLVPVSGAALIILFGAQKTVVARILSMPIFVGIGLISYSVYLWHQPLFAFARMGNLYELSQAHFLFLSALSIALAWVTWRYIEQPFRARPESRPVLSGKKLAATAIGFTVFFIAIGIIGNNRIGFERIYNERVLWTLSFKTDINPRRSECFDKVPLFSKEAPCVYGAPGQVKVALLGDSHAETLVWELGKALDNRGLGLVQLNKLACLPIRRLYPVSHPKNLNCSVFNEAVFEYLKTSPVDTLVLAGRWTIYNVKERFNNLEGGVENEGDSRVDVVGHVSNGNEEDRKTRVNARYKEGIKELLSLGKKVILVYPIPEAGWHVPRHLAKASMYGVYFGGRLSTSYEQFKNRNEFVNAALDEIEHPNLVRVKPADILCNNIVKGRCLNQLNGVPLYIDENHLSNRGARLVVKRIVNAMQNTH